MTVMNLTPNGTCVLPSQVLKDKLWKANDGASASLANVKTAGFKKAQLERKKKKKAYACTLRKGVGGPLQGATPERHLSDS